MKLTICGSIAFIDEMVRVKTELEDLGHEVKIPSTDIKNKDGEYIPSKDFYQLKKNSSAGDDWMWKRVNENILRHFKKIEWSNAILVTNYDKNNISGYIGGNTLIECGIALYLEKNIFLLNNIPKMDYEEELRAMGVTVLNGDFSKLRRG